MRKTMSIKQVEANRRNAQKSTGPKTAEGQTVSKMNALKHGILSKEVLIGGINARESRSEFKKLHRRFWEGLDPVGPVEEMLVDQIVTAHWRLRRALTAESGEIALSVDGGQWHRETHDLKRTTLSWEMDYDPTVRMADSAFGNLFMERQLEFVRKAVEMEGELTDAVLQEVKYLSKPYSLTEELRAWREEVRQECEGLSPEDSRARQKEGLLKKLGHKISMVSWRRSRCEKREQKEEEARQAAASLPSVEVLEKIQRYETKLERQMFRAMAQLERLQRMRQGEAVPAPMSVAVA